MAYTTNWGVNLTNILVPLTGVTQVYTITSVDGLFGNTPSEGPGKGGLVISSATNSNIMLSVSCNGTVYTSNADRWVGISVPQGASVTYTLSSTNGASSIAQVDSFFELNSHFSGYTVNALDVVDGTGMTAEYGLSGLRVFEYAVTEDGTIEFATDGAYPAISATFTNGSSVSSTGMIAQDTSFNSTLTGLGYPAATVPSDFSSLATIPVLSGDTVYVRVFCPLNYTAFQITGILTPAPSVEDPWEFRATESETGTRRHLRLRHLGYNA